MSYVYVLCTCISLLYDCISVLHKIIGNYIIINRPRPIMLKILPIMLLSSPQKIAHYAQYYARKY